VHDRRMLPAGPGVSTAKLPSMNGDLSFSVTPDEAHERLDVILARRLALSRAQTRRLLERGQVRLDGSPVGRAVKGVALEAGARVEVEGFVHPSAQQAVAQPDLALVVLAEGPGWVAVDKPAGMPVHPLEPDATGTVLNALAARHPEVHGVGEGGLRSGVVHRLDVDTSGVQLMATDPGVWERLRAGFSEHRVAKRYRAVVSGDPGEAGRLDLRLAMVAHKPARVGVARGKGGTPARLAFRRAERLRGASLLEVELETGFLHQIRASFAHAGHPVLGDRTYGGAVADAAPRQMLHCARVALEEIDATSPDPPDLCAVIESLR